MKTTWKDVSILRPVASFKTPLTLSPLDRSLRCPPARNSWILSSVVHSGSCPLRFVQASRSVVFEVLVALGICCENLDG